MNPDIILEIGLLISGFIATWAVMKYRIDRLEKDLGEDKKAYVSQLEKLWNWKDKHEDEASKERLALHERISKLQGAWDASTSTLAHIGSQMTNIAESIRSMQQDLADLKAEKRARDK